MSFKLPALCSKNIVSNFKDNVVSYNSEDELIKKLIDLKENKKSNLYPENQFYF